MKERSQTRKVFDIAAYAVVSAAVFINVILFYWLIFPIDPGTQISELTIPDVVYTGTSVYAEVDYCKTVPGPAVSSYSLVSSEQVFYFEPIESHRPLGCDNARIQVQIPSEAPVGVAHFELDVLREYNPLHKDVISVKSNEFEIKHP